MELDDIQSLLRASGIEVDPKTLLNPTEEFMIKVTTEFMKKFHIDADEIIKLSPEQMDCVYCEDSAGDAVTAINLHAALATICDSIYLKDLTLMDIISPGSKKTQKRIKMLFNFHLYVKNSDMGPSFDELDRRHETFQNIIEQTAQMKAKIGSYINERELKLELKDKLENEIKEISCGMEKDQHIAKNLHKYVEEITTNYRENLKKFDVWKARVYELQKVTKDLQSKVVESPDEYITRSKELKKVLDGKMEERQNLKECVDQKKNQILKNEAAEVEVRSHHDKIFHLKEIVKKIEEIAFQLDANKKQVKDLSEEIILLERKPKNQSNDCKDSVDIGKIQKLLTELHNIHGEKQRELEELKKCSEKLQTEKKTLNETLEKEEMAISITQRNHSKFMKDIKNHYDNEISQVLFNLTLSRR